MDDIILDFSNQIEKLNNFTLLANVPKNKDNFLIQWCILPECNYKCTYCFGQDTLNNAIFTPIEKLKHAVDQIFSLNKKSYLIELIGGEITYYPYLIELIEYIQSFHLNVFLHFVSNGSKSIEYFDNLLKHIKIQSEFKISIHMEYANIEHIKNLIKIFNKNNVNINIALMAHPVKKNETINFFDELLEFRKYNEFNLYIGEIREGINFSNIDSRYDSEYSNWIDKSRILWNETFTKYKKDNIKYFSSIIQSVNILENKVNKDRIKASIEYGTGIKTKARNFKDFYCCCGFDVLNIAPNGSYRGTVCNASKSIGNIYKDNIDILEIMYPLKCPMVLCTCDLNDNIHKFRNLDDVNTYINENIHNNIFYLMKNINTKFNNIIYQINDIKNNDVEIDNNIKLINQNINNSNIKLNKVIDALAWCIPIKKWRDNFRYKFSIEDNK